ncbi:thioester reductase domain-containing protein [Paraphaeosphaeria sporulosa]
MARGSHPQSRNKVLIHVLDDIARDNPSKIFAEIPNSPTTFADGFRKVTYQELSNAVNGIAAHLERGLGKGKSTETLAYVGLQDLRYVILLLGAVKAGYSMLFFSPRFPPLAAATLFRQTGIKTILISNPRLPFLAPILEQHPLQELGIPDLQALLDTEYPHYAYNVSFEEARNQPFITVHTSGSTGFPKPIIATHDWVASIAEEIYLEPPEGYMSTLKPLFDTKIYFQFPFFHMSFVIGNVILPLLTGTTVVYPPAGVPPSATSVAEVAEANDISLIALSPLTILQLHQDDKLLDRIAARVPRLLYSGGDIPTAVGDALSKKVHLANAMASTECGIYHGIVPASLPVGTAWHSLGFHPASNVTFVQREGDIYEAIIRRTENKHTQPIFRIFPDKQEYATGDLYRRHSQLEGLWDHQGRNDDMLVFASGEKFWPVDVESRISQHPSVSEALVIGTGRQRAALLLELQPTAGERTTKETLDEVWPAIEATHAMCSPAARILRAFVVVADQERPFVKTPKGTVARGPTATLYAAALAELDRAATQRGIAAPESAVEISTGGVQL